MGYELDKIIRAWKVQYGESSLSKSGISHMSVSYKTHPRREMYAILIQYLIEKYEFTNEDFNDTLLNKIVNESTHENSKSPKQWRKNCANDWSDEVARAFPINMGVEVKRAIEPKAVRSAEQILPKKVESTNPPEQKSSIDPDQKPDYSIDLDDFDFHAPSTIIDRPAYDKKKNDLGIKVGDIVNRDLNLLADISGDDDESK